MDPRDGLGRLESGSRESYLMTTLYARVAGPIKNEAMAKGQIFLDIYLLMQGTTDAPIR